MILKNYKPGLKNRWLFFLFFFLVGSVEAQKTKQQKVLVVASVPGKVWSAEKAWTWYNEHKWITGANFLPSTAINQLEMWQAATFDSATIDRELG